MLLESPDLDFVLPHFVVELNIIKDSIDESLNIWILVTEQLKYNCDHLGLVENDVSRWCEEEELEESVQDLLDHFVILLFGSEEILQHFDEE